MEETGSNVEARDTATIEKAEHKEKHAGPEECHPFHSYMVMTHLGTRSTSNFQY
jgi:hypothetical protein